MSNNFQKSLTIIRDQAKTEVAKGNAFEKLCKIFFENDDIQKQQYSKVWHYKDWAKENPSFSKTDIGIDLVAELKDGSGLTAIQCKCYDSEYSVTKEDIDSFISASNNEIFKRLILIDTSSNEIGTNAQSVINNLNKDYIRIQTAELEQSRIDWLTFIKEDKIILADKKEPLDHQIKAIKAAEEYFKGNNRGKLIMACGTGKTFTSLRIAEKIAGKGKFILYMVPSLALMSQSIREWKNDCEDDFEAFSACSDKKVGKKKAADDEIIVNLTDLAFPATTDSEKLAKQINNSNQSKMIVIFSTYQSIDVISEAQKKYKLRKFDLILCDEAHRTTGATLTGKDESHFVKIHSDENISGEKRLYMTATPKIYGEKAKIKADEGQAELASMDDENKFGKTFYSFGFNKAVDSNLLTDYKVIILAIDEEKVSSTLQRSFEEGSELKLDNATKIIGCYKALAKVGIESNLFNNQPIKKALAFTQSIEISKLLKKEFVNVVKDYSKKEKIEKKYKANLEVEVEHIDGTDPADKRNEKLNWLKEDAESNDCRILTNVKCLSEGVDVPSLDAIMFLHPRKSQIDVVQSVGRVMRKAEGKSIGYVIIPITVAPGVSPEKALDDNERYKVVWQILNALRSHDDRMDNAINKISIGEDVTDKIQIDEIVTTIDDIKKDYEKKDDKDKEKVTSDLIEEDKNKDKKNKEQLVFELGDLSKAIRAKIVQKCGTRDYWEQWATDISTIAKTHITRLNSLLVKKDSKERKTFDSFLKEIRDDLNPEISETDAIEMLAQHIITKPVFETLFEGNDFTKDNTISKALEKILNKIYKTNIGKETDTLQNFYRSVQRRAKDIETARGKTTLLNELYERFFKNAFPLTASKLGIVYTPVEAVDFMLKSVNYILQKDFNKKIEDKNVHVLDPFTGTGTFIARLLQSGLISKDKIGYKYAEEIHANEIILLAYYVAGINIETVYQQIKKGNQYKPFNGMVLTDTFQLYEQERDMIDDLLPDNSLKRTNQKNRKITVILGNPPYSAGQSSANDNAQNIKYQNLDEKIKSTYAKYSKATRQGSLYDSYVRSFRWASDRIKDHGIVSFITNASWIDANAMDGMRKCFYDEFSDIYIFNLRGNQRTSGELSRKEGGKIFGSGSRTPIAITFLVKNSNKKNCEIHYHDIGDYLDRKEKLKKISKIGSIENLIKDKKFNKITPDNENDWINQGLNEYKEFISMGSKNKNDKDIKIFKQYSSGLKTSRDSWNYNFSKKDLIKNVKTSINFYNSELERYNKSTKNKKPIDFVTKDSSKITWDRPQIQGIERNKRIKFNENSVMQCLYRPFTKTWGYTDDKFNNCVYQLPKIFPENNCDNLVILSPGTGFKGEFSTFIMNNTPDLGFLSACYCFPFKLYNKNDDGLFNIDEEISSINKDALELFQKKLNNKKIKYEDIFYYIYALFHCEEYKNKYHNNLTKEIPRIPISKSFEKFAEIGKKLADIHLNYEELYKDHNLEIIYKNKDSNKNLKKYYQTENIKFKGKQRNPDKTEIIFNNNITITKIPLEIYNYTINGKSAVEWVMERQKITFNEETKISNNANNYANETRQDSEYILKLLISVINLSLETLKLIKKIPELNIIK
tara:strand:+ start:426 stop:5255 length:4830 start_codon:yes stop_codon:yes gene_type:complete